MKKNKHVAKIRSLDEHIALAKRYNSGTSYVLAEKPPGYFNDYRHIRSHYNCPDFAKIVGWKSKRPVERMPKPTLTTEQTKIGSVVVKASLKEHYEKLPKLDVFNCVDAQESMKLSQISNTTNMLRMLTDVGLLECIGIDMLHQRGRKRHLFKRVANWKFKVASPDGNWLIASKK